MSDLLRDIYDVINKLGLFAKLEYLYIFFNFQGIIDHCDLCEQKHFKILSAQLSRQIILLTSALSVNNNFNNQIELKLVLPCAVNVRDKWKKYTVINKENSFVF